MDSDSQIHKASPSNCLVFSLPAHVQPSEVTKEVKRVITVEFEDKSLSQKISEYASKKLQKFRNKSKIDPRPYKDYDEKSGMYLFAIVQGLYSAKL